MAITPDFCCGFECGVSTTTSHWVTGVKVSFETSRVRTDRRSLKVNGGDASNAGSSTTNTGIITSSTRHIVRFAIYFESLPSVDIFLAGTTTNGPCVRFKQSDSKIYASVGTTLGATGVAVTTGQWYVIDCDFNINTGGNDTSDAQVNGSACAQATATGLSAAVASIFLGMPGTTVWTGVLYFDDVVVSHTGADYPIGDGRVLSFVPAYDGTHTATTTTIVKGTTAVPVGAVNVAGNVDAYKYVNARPLGGGEEDATRLINQQTAGTTLYCEVGFEPYTGASAPRAVEVITADFQASTATGDFTTKLNDNGTEDTIVARGVVAGVLADRQARKHYPTMVGGGTWTLARFNALKARFGYASDATPDQYWRGIMIEAEFPIESISIRPEFCCGFECGILSTLAHWKNNGGTAATFETSTPITGLRSLSHNTNNGAFNNTLSVATFGTGIVILRAVIRFPSAVPTADKYLVTTSGTGTTGAVFQNSDSKIYAVANGTKGATGVAVEANSRYFLDIKIDTTNNPWLVDVQVNRVACGQASSATAADLTAQAISLGDTNATGTKVILFDDILVSVTPPDYPIGDGRVISYVPNVDGTHTATSTNIVKGTAAIPVGAAITSATTDAFNWVNARPIGGGATDATRLINQQTLSATQYAEVGFEDSVEPLPPRAVEVLSADQQAATTAGDMQIRLVDNSIELPALIRPNAAGVITDRYVTGQFREAIGSGAWTLARFNALKIRFGYSGDATPDQYWRGSIIEAEYPPLTSLLPPLPRPQFWTKRRRLL